MVINLVEFIAPNINCALFDISCIETRDLSQQKWRLKLLKLQPVLIIIENKSPELKIFTHMNC